MFGLYQQRANYWTCSDFSDKIRNLVGVSKPSSETAEGWNVWKKSYKTNHPWVYWITEEFLDLCQDVVYLPYDILLAIRDHLYNRFIDKPHYLDTKLKRGEYHGIDTRILFGLFETLVDFVEIEKAWMQVVFSDEEFKKYNYPWYCKNRITRWAAFRCPEAGLDHLKWEMELDDEHSEGQRESAKIQYKLYDWWKNIRPNRPDPYDVSGWNEIDHTREDGMLFKPRTEEEDKLVRDVLTKIDEIEGQYLKEDTEMLIELINIRSHLWT